MEKVVDEIKKKIIKKVSHLGQFITNIGTRSTMLGPLSDYGTIYCPTWYYEMSTWTFPPKTKQK